MGSCWIRRFGNPVPLPKAYAVVTYRSISDPEKLAAYAKLALPALVPSLPVAMQWLPENRGLRSVP
jgi:hypothetical protein